MNADQLRTIVPFVLPPVIPTNQTTRCGTGVIVPVTAAANTPVTVTHGLARKVQAAFCIRNNGGLDFTAAIKYGATINNNQRVDVTGSVAMTDALVVFF
jgi:hypothetical protein